MKGWAGIGAQEAETQVETNESIFCFDEEINLGLPKEKKNMEGKAGESREVRPLLNLPNPWAGATPY